jgi:hypothetical protein
MTTVQKHFILTLVAMLAVATSLRGQQVTTPHLGYVFPAGGRQGASFQARVGGQYLGNVSNAFFSGAGIQAEVVDYVRPLTGQQLNQLREELKKFQEKRSAAQTFPALTAADRMRIIEIREKIAQSQKRMLNPAISEVVTLKITISSNALPGERELRLGSPLALSQPLVFCVGQLPEFNKPAPVVDTEERTFRPRNETPKATPPVESYVTLPCVINGQTLPGEVDHYRFQARQGQRLVIAANARELIPYLADAVPGWFQAVLSLSDNKGHEVAYADHFRFHPDPVLYYEVPKDGQYVLHIKDSIYRGREDFVYRITVGEVPFVTDFFPLGGPAGSKITVKVSGWNLPETELAQDATDLAPGIYPLSVRTEKSVSNHHPFAVDALPECFSHKSIHSQATAQRLTLPIIVNGRIDKPGQWDVFSFEGNAGDEIVAEVIARRLDSPLDSVLRLTDHTGKQLAFNDDYEDKGAGLQTQYADSYLRLTLPANGAYYLYLGDAQHQGGPEYAYRLRLSQPRPDFALRIVPSSLAVRGGMSVPFTVHALRRDGFTNDISLALKDAPPGFTLSGNKIPANQDHVRLTLMAPTLSSRKDFSPAVEGYALIQNKAVVHPAVPSENMMQAFAYWHLVPSKELEVSFMDRPAARFALKLLDPTPIKIPAGGTAQVRVSSPNRATNNLQLELNEPPEGISIKNVSRGEGETTIFLQSDAARIKPGTTGNLIVNIVANRQRANPAAAKARRNQQGFVVGSLPAIPFEIIAPELLAK